MLCADLVDVQWKDQTGRTRRGVANLEDISRSGACLQVDRPVPLGTSFRFYSDLPAYGLLTCSLA